jgi:hypothetical protein
MGVSGISGNKPGAVPDSEQRGGTFSECLVACSCSVNDIDRLFQE